MSFRLLLAVAVIQVLPAVTFASTIYVDYRLEAAWLQPGRIIGVYDQDDNEITDHSVLGEGFIEDFAASGTGHPYRDILSYVGGPTVYRLELTISSETSSWYEYRGDIRCAPRLGPWVICPGMYGAEFNADADSGVSFQMYSAGFYSQYGFGQNGHGFMSYEDDSFYQINSFRGYWVETMDWEMYLAFSDVRIYPASVPLPASGLLLGGVVAALPLLRRRRAGRAG